VSGHDPDRLEGRQSAPSSSNRNFKGRQSSAVGRTLLMSPAMVAAAAVVVTSPMCASCLLAPHHPSIPTVRQRFPAVSFVARTLHQYHFQLAPTTRGPAHPRVHAAFPSGPIRSVQGRRGDSGDDTHDRIMSRLVPSSCHQLEGREQPPTTVLSWPGPIPLFGLSAGIPDPVCNRKFRCGSSREMPPIADALGDPACGEEALLRVFFATSLALGFPALQVKP